MRDALTTNTNMKVKKAWFIGTDGTVRQLTELEGKELSLKAMYPIIGCDIVEHVGLKKGVDMWVDEEGLLKGEFVINQKATLLYQGAYPDSIFPPVEELVIVGNAIVTDNTKAGDYLKI